MAQFHIRRVKKAEREPLGRRRVPEESSLRFWMEYDPMGIYPEGRAPGAQPQWVDLAEAIRGTELPADYAGENLIPGIGAWAGRHLDELMKYAVRLEQGGMALADGAKERAGADG